MQRKLVQQGSSTLMVSLPRKWIKSKKLQKGSVVNLHEAQGKLVVSSLELQKIKKVTLNITTNTESSIRTAIVNAYRTGYDHMVISSHNQFQIETIDNTLKEYLIGFEIIEKDHKTCTIENITEPSVDQFEVILQKIFFNVRQLAQATKKKMYDPNIKVNYKEISLKIHQYDNFCRRVMVKKQLREGKSELYWAFLSTLTHCQRDLYHLNKYLEKKTMKFEKSELIEGVLLFTTLLEKAFLEKDIESIEEIHRLEKEYIYLKGYQELRESPIVSHHIVTCIRNLYLASSPLLGILLEKHQVQD